MICKLHKLAALIYGLYGISYYYLNFYSISKTGSSLLHQELQLFYGPYYLGFLWLVRHYYFLAFQCTSLYYLATPYIYFRLSPCTWGLWIFRLYCHYGLIYDPSDLLIDLLYYLATCIYILNCPFPVLELCISWPSYYLQPMKFLWSSLIGNIWISIDLLYWGLNLHIGALYSGPQY